MWCFDWWAQLCLRRLFLLFWGRFFPFPLLLGSLKVVFGRSPPPRFSGVFLVFICWVFSSRLAFLHWLWCSLRCSWLAFFHWLWGSPHCSRLAFLRWLWSSPNCSRLASLHWLWGSWYYGFQNERYGSKHKMVKGWLNIKKRGLRIYADRSNHI